MGGKSSSSSSTANSTQVQELNLQDTGGFTIADNKGGTNLNYTSNTVDPGAVAAGANVADTALASNTSIFNRAVEAINAALGANASLSDSSSRVLGSVAGKAISSNANTTQGAFNFASGLSSDVNHAAITLGQTALDTGGSLATAGLDHAAAAYQSGLTFQNDALTTVANIAQDSLLHQESLTNNAISGFQSIAQQNSASDSTQVQKIAVYAVAAAVLIVVLPAMFKS